MNPSHRQPILAGRSGALLTDLYQVTMAYGYWRTGEIETQGAFNLSYRHNPFEGGYAIACGLGYLVDYIESYRFDDDDIAYLETLTGSDGKALFETDFLSFLRHLEIDCNIDAVPEGTVVFPHEPLVRITGSLLQCQLLETPLLNMINFQTLLATKASRICAAAQGDPVIEFGLRRAQGFDGAMAASRAAFIGGCESTSNVLAAREFGIPARGTHAHSWVMTFDSELEAFTAYAEAMPNNCILLVDTYDTLQGVRHAVEVGRKLKSRGGKLLGIRLDSGDLAYLSVEARKILDAAGFEDAAIVASNDLNEHVITSLKDQGAAINVWGVGTELVTSFDQPALGAVYKLAAIRRGEGPWQPKIKLSEQAVKINNPGLCQVRRFSAGDGFIADMIYDESTALREPHILVDPMDSTRRRPIKMGSDYADLLVPVVRGGEVVYDLPEATVARQYAGQQLGKLHPSIKRFLHPHQYPVGLEQGLFEMKTALILAAREEVDRAAGRELG